MFSVPTNRFLVKHETQNFVKKAEMFVLHRTSLNSIATTAGLHKTLTSVSNNQNTSFLLSSTCSSFRFLLCLSSWSC